MINYALKRGHNIMRKFTLMGLIMVAVLVLLAACGNDGKNTNDNANENELPFLEVEFQLPETVEVGEEVELVAIVTFDEKPVEDASQMDFEVWEKGDKDNGVMLAGEHVGDGKYVTTYTFEHDGIFESYAHTTAEGMHTMPRREITVGEGGEYDDVEENDEDHHDHHE